MLIAVLMIMLPDGLALKRGRTMKAKNYKYLILSMIVIVGGSLFAKQSMAEGGYVGISGGYLDTDITNHMAVNLHGGYAFNDFISMEGRVLINSSEEGYHGASIEIDSLYGLYIMGTVPISDDLSVYAVFGHSRAEATASYDGYSATADDSGSSVGFGVKFNLLEAWTVRLERTELLDGMDMTQATLTLNF